MIQSLYVRNYVLIDELEMQFSEGFTTITGETGAGKSILIGALSLILGQRVDTSVLKLKEAKCVVEGSFKPGPELRKVFASHDLDFEVPSILRREIAPGGKARAFINDTPVNLPVLKEVGKHLVDIHSQHQNLQLSDHLYQMGVIDYLARTDADMSQYQEAFGKFRELGAEIERVRDESSRLKEELEYMQFQFNELQSAHLKEGELESLEAELQRAGNAEEIGNALSGSTVHLLQEESGILDRLREVLNRLGRISGVYGPAAELAGRMESAYIELKDLAAEVESLAGKSELDPGKLEQLQERINLLFGLMHKHRVRDVSGLIALREELSARIEEVTFSDERIRSLEKEKAALLGTMEKAAGNMHLLRAAAGEEMQKKVEDQLKDLGIPNARFRVEIVHTGEFGLYGADEIRFLFSANKQVALEEISRVASGGEVSRLMLCIKALVSDRKGMPTLIFDEIDAGVSGEIAEKVGGLMASLAGGRQVVAITHLPQLASMGSDHFIVYKEDTDKATYTRIRKLDLEERINEIARMLSGESVTDAALSNARVLLRVS
jgi:DNA repair protein RecN (Recombination protein N)